MSSDDRWTTGGASEVGSSDSILMPERPFSEKTVMERSGLLDGCGESDVSRNVRHTRRHPRIFTLGHI